MSKFVNYNKRSVTLPVGCQNLIDLLQPQNQGGGKGTTSAEPQFDVARNESGLIRLAAIREHVVECFESRAVAADVTFRLPDESLTFSLTHMEEGSIHASASLREDSARERLMREFYHAHKQSVSHGDGPHTRTFPGLPVYLLYHISQPPTDAITFSTFVADLFRYVCGISEDSEIAFHYHEMVKRGVTANNPES